MKILNIYVMKKKKSLKLTLNKMKVSELSLLESSRVLGGNGATSGYPSATGCGCGGGGRASEATCPTTPSQSCG